MSYILPQTAQLCLYVFIFANISISDGLLELWSRADPGDGAVPPPRGVGAKPLQAPQIEAWNTTNQLSFCQFLECQAPCWKLSGDGSGTAIAPSKTYASNFIHHGFVQFGKHHSWLNTILSQQCSVYFISCSTGAAVNLYNQILWNRLPLTLPAGSTPGCEGDVANAVFAQNVTSTLDNFRFNIPTVKRGQRFKNDPIPVYPRIDCNCYFCNYRVNFA